MKSIVIIGTYFGKFPNNIDLWLKSCSYNPTIDFLIFTDQEKKTTYKNVKFINLSFNELNDLVKKKIGSEYIISEPYKCCDFKTVYGVIFEDYIKKYDFWGHCDFDLIFGDIRKFITDEILNKYDKILPYGHLSLYLNIPEVNGRYKLEGSLIGNYDYVFKCKQNLAFDELRGIGSIYEKNGFPFYKERVFADISFRIKRFILGLNDKNYKYQLFYWDNGHVYRAFYYKGKIEQDEFAYIHFQKRKNMNHLIDNIDKCNSFYINNYGFFEKNKKVDINEIKLINKYNGFLYEFFEMKLFNLKMFYNKIKNKFF